MIRKALQTRTTDPRPQENDDSRDSLNKVIIFRKRIAGLSPPTLERFVLRARKAIRLRDTVNVLLTSSRELRSLNRQFRRIDKPTDVLSFPAPRAVPRQTRRFAGDVAISADIARENAIRMGHSVAHEVKILALHGILHLAGFDHERDHGEMAREESRLRRNLKLEIGLIERSPGILHQPLKKKRKVTGLSSQRRRA
ncbi:MAG TPA: rRNA maturation RNase YbeY [Candidatus Acidoferrum sp.]|nr:rRNA maturation RNase YbeY [Candidatus Acidoferrum sp.]